MDYFKVPPLGLCAIGLGSCLSLAHGQAQLADEIVIISKGQREIEQSQSRASSGASGVFGFSPGSPESRLAPDRRRGPAARSLTVRRDVLSALSSPLGAALPAQHEGISEDAPATPTDSESPFYGSLDLPEVEDEGPANGLTIEQAIDRLIAENPDLQSKALEIPKAEADVLTAGLRGNPLVFASADDVPYHGNRI